ncbi:MAG: beta-N-acetylhexosaminidase [Phycisphaerales bacterium]
MLQNYFNKQKKCACIFIILIAYSTLCFSNDLNTSFSIVPRPAILEVNAGQFVLAPPLRIMLKSDDALLWRNAEYLQRVLANSTGYDVIVSSDANSVHGKNIIFELCIDANDLGAEGYKLEVTANYIKITSKTPAGNFYGCQTLRQLLSADIEKTFIVQRTWQIPCCRIIDKPCFKWRGMHLDVSRHFFNKSFIKKYLDLLSLYKINVFHWHLTDDEGWRIEIKKYPKLTEVGACRGPKTTASGNFYTQNDIKEIVAYAKERYITIVPEIEMPGHCNAALYAYPELSCTGRVLKTGNDNSRFYFLQEGRFAYCAGKETTFSFLEDVLSEVAELFDSPYIHIGGDERPENLWEQCPVCQKRMQQEGLKNTDELQQYFIRRIEKFLLSKQKRLIGWDQITSDKLAKSSIVISYQSLEPAKKMAKAGNDVILALAENCYFDWYQSKSPDEPKAIGGLVTLKKAYSLNPVLKGLTKEQQSHILGAQGCLWTEYIEKSSHAEYMTFPRICATSEILWSPKKVRGWKDFERRMRSHYNRFDNLNVAYHKYNDKDVIERNSLKK